MPRKDDGRVCCISISLCVTLYGQASIMKSSWRVKFLSLRALRVSRETFRASSSFKKDQYACEGFRRHSGTMVPTPHSAAYLSRWVPLSAITVWKGGAMLLPGQPRKLSDQGADLNLSESRLKFP